MDKFEGESEGESEDNGSREARGVDGGDTLGVRAMIYRQDERDWRQD
jgi:hypothetical protein